MSQLLYNPTEAAQALGTSRATIYLKIASGEIESVKIGKLRRIPAAALTAYVQRLRTEQNGDWADSPVEPGLADDPGEPVTPTAVPDLAASDIESLDDQCDRGRR
jgi:excisionase family DNA binding protein